MTPDPDHVEPGAGQTGGDRRLEELAGGARVAADDGDRTGAAGPGRSDAAVPALDEHMGSGDREAEGQLGGQVGVGQTANPVGAEEPGAADAAARLGRCGTTAWSTGEPCGPS